MQYQELGRTGLQVSRICLGTMTWGRQNTQEEAFAQMDYALDQGVNFWDTAELYAVPPLPETYGKTETMIGNWFAKTGRRQDVILASKIAGCGKEWIRDGQPYTAADVMPAIDASLSRLQTDYIDLYQLHWPNRGGYHFRGNWAFDPTSQPDLNAVEDDMLSILEALNDAVKAGKIRHVGLSNESAWGTMQYLRLAEKHNLPRMASIQNEYSLLYRPFDLDLAEVSHYEDVTLLAYSPLATGLLTGKYQFGQIPANTRAAINRLDGRMSPQAMMAVERYLQVAKTHGLDVAQMALAFILNRPYSPVVIIGATSMDQLKTNISAMDLTLSDAVLSDLQGVYRDFPMAM